jgi:RNA polymerase sigma factor (sigma-70 family)
MASLFPPPTILVVDDEKSVRDSICWLFNSIGIEVKAFESAQAFLDSGVQCAHGCVILDVRMPTISGIQMQDILRDMNFSLPLIFLSAYGDAQMGAQAIKKGAIDFLQKPYRSQDLLDSVNDALRRSREALRKQSERIKYFNWLESLSQRETETLELVVDGKSSKEIARALGISYKTVEAHRARILKKLGARTTSDLVRLAVLKNTNCRDCRWLTLPASANHCDESAFADRYSPSKS